MVNARLPLWVEERGALRFECTRCTHCCHGPGWIHFAPGEVSRIAAFLKMDEAVLRARHISDESMHLPEGSACPFLKDNACGVQDVKPLQCRAWPFFPEMLETELQWLVASQNCPGMGQGREHSLEEIRTWVDGVGPMPK